MKATINDHRDYIISKIDNRLYGSFLEHFYIFLAALVSLILLSFVYLSIICVVLWPD
jgi:alpha-L-arabinofuranosidase